MASPLNPVVLAAAALLTAPALYESLVIGALPALTAGIRFAVAVIVIWIGTSLIGSLVAATSAPRVAPAPASSSSEGPRTDQPAASELSGQTS